MAVSATRRLLVLVIFTALLFGCYGEDQQAEQLGTGEIAAAAVYSGDLSAIRQQGVLRIAGVENDYAAELNRSGLPAITYQDYADAFAKSIGLKPVWYYYADLASALASTDAGLSDLVMSNITVTDTRRERYKVDFSRPLMANSEYSCRS